MAEAPTLGVLIAGHGEAKHGDAKHGDAKHGDAEPGEPAGASGNGGVVELAQALARRHPAWQVRHGFLKGEPAVAAALQSLTPREAVVVPLFLADGHFSRTVLASALTQAMSRMGRETVRVLPPLGLLPGLAEVIDRAAADCAAREGLEPGRSPLILLAHGSTRNPASRIATQELAQRVGHCGRFSDIRPAFLEEQPSLPEAIGRAQETAIVVGLFVGTGLHGGTDVTRLMAALGRERAVDAGSLLSFPGMMELIAAAIQDARDRESETVSR